MNVWPGQVRTSIIAAIADVARRERRCITMRHVIGLGDEGSLVIG
jgi:hypothetical protein